MAEKGLTNGKSQSNLIYRKPYKERWITLVEGKDFGAWDEGQRWWHAPSMATNNDGGGANMEAMTMVVDWWQ